MTWSEARDHLLRCGRGLELPVYVDGGERGLVPLGSAVPAWQRPDLVEEVAAGLVLGEGRQFFPLDPAVAETPNAVPWPLASELVYRLSLLLSDQLTVSPGTAEERRGCIPTDRDRGRLVADDAHGTWISQLSQKPFGGTTVQQVGHVFLFASSSLALRERLPVSELF
jgi:hypothetical protein